MRPYLVCLLLLPLIGCQAFLLPSNTLRTSQAVVASSSSHGSRVSLDMRNRRSVVVMAAAAAASSGGRGFKLSYGDAEGPQLLDTLQQKKCWEQEYKAYIKRNGKQICSMSWRGFETYGRGAVFAKYDVDAGRPSPSEVDLRAAIPSIYVDLGKWEESGKEEGAADLSNLQQIVDRVMSYDPEKQFVVVFQSHGLMGADVVTPNISPREMATLLAREEEQQAALANGIIDVAASST